MSNTMMPKYMLPQRLVLYMRHCGTDCFYQAEWVSILQYIQFLLGLTSSDGCCIFTVMGLTIVKQAKMSGNTMKIFVLCFVNQKLKLFFTALLLKITEIATKL